MRNKNFITAEYYLAVTPLALKEELIEVRGSAAFNRSFFVFRGSPTLDKNIEGFRRGEIRIEPQELFIKHKLLKSRIYNNY